jgi:hypothetical protein
MLAQPLNDRIDAMIKADPAIGTAAIWQRLTDDHGATRPSAPTCPAVQLGKTTAVTCH